ncbi:MAG TPA: tetratricopeptide repeat protein [Chthoniobacterales bacterium]|jgi:TolA-binding protein|nr:tetratricopeptide repeat protein [Chthoniobacterales bacterium]
MKIAGSVAGLFGLALLFWIVDAARAQRPPDIRPPDQPPVTRALPAEEPTMPPPTAETEAPDRRQLGYANALFTRKLYDLAIPEYQKYLDDYPGGAGRANAYFSLGECYRNLNKPSSARTNFQRVLNDYGESEFAGPAAYALAEIAFTQKDYATALPLFHRSAAKSKESAVALSARYFEARCLEVLDHKDEACDIYQQVAEAKGPNPYREDARQTAASIAFARGRKSDALRQYEALANETQKAPLKAEATVRAGLIALDLLQSDKGKMDKGMSEKAMALLQKGRSLPEAGRWRALAQVGILRLQYQTGQYVQLLADYKKVQQQVPEEARAEVMLFAANSQRQLGHAAEAEAIYHEIIEKYPNREEAKDARFQRLINVYNSDPSTLPPEVDEFLTTNPTAERADQAKLFKAEALYKQQNYPRAAPIFSELRASQLSPKLRAEAAYQLGSCYLQMKDVAGIVEAFGFFVQAFPDSPLATSAFARRAETYESDKNYDAALSDWNMLLTKYPGAREREEALQHKALILGQQQNPKGMSETFRQLLKEFPKSPAASIAHYYIGKSAFELKDYKTALAALNTARQLDKDRYYVPATVRIISSYFGLHDRAAVTREVDGFLAANAAGTIPAEILEWLGIEYYNEKNYAAAEKYLGVLGKIDNPPVKPDFWFYLGDAAAKQQKFDESENAFGKYLQTATDPAGKAKVLLALGAVKIAAHKPDDAQKIAEQIMTLQPEGRVNAEARLLSGDVQFERGHFEDAGKAFMGVALLYDDPAITPRALQKAALAYRRAGKPDEADRVAKQLREKYPNYAGG